MSSSPAWSTRASSRTGSKATKKPCLGKPNIFFSQKYRVMMDLGKHVFVKVPDLS